MTQNTSHAVMAQRKSSLLELDDFPTPMWATRALCETVLPVALSMTDNSPDLSRYRAWEPAANRGYMADALAGYFDKVWASDVEDYGRGYPVIDFLAGTDGPLMADFIITNPPFKAAGDFVDEAMRKALYGCAILARTTWVETKLRYDLFLRHRPALIAQFVERVPMVKGRIDAKASTATAYCWIVFMRGHASMTRWMHIPPCRKRLERDGDYEVRP